MSNARIQFSTASEEKWLQVNPVLREGELVIARKANGKRKLVVGKPGGSSYANSEVVWDAEQAESYMNTTKDLSENVNVFVPHIDSSGVLTWTNKAGLNNPDPITIKGIKGDPGEKGEPGQRGEQGAQGIQGPRGIQGEQGERGVQGAQGPAGNAATITIGNITTSAPGTSASVTNRGTSSAAVLDFVLPKGKDGADGGVTVDDALSDSSTNPVQNKVIKAALDNRAALDDVNTFTSPNNFDIIYMKDGIGSVRWYSESPSFVIGSINAKNYTGNAATATKANKDSEGNVITDTYSKKADFDKVIKDLDVAFQEKVDKRDLADVATSGSYNDLSNRPAYVVQSVNNVKPDTNGNVNITVSGGSNVTVDAALSATSTNAIQNKAVYNALSGKLDKTGTADKATKDSAGNVITDTYAKKTDISGMVKSVNNVKPDSNGNVTIDISGGSGVSTSESNTWTAQQNFRDLMLNREKYTTYVVNGTSDTPVTSTMVYAVTGAFTLNLATLAGALSASQSSVFTAYFAANADYSLTISNAGKLKYTGSASDVAITTSGLLLNIWMSKDGGGTLTSIVQATKLS